MRNLSKNNLNFIEPKPRVTRACHPNKDKVTCTSAILSQRSLYNVYYNMHVCNLIDVTILMTGLGHFVCHRLLRNLKIWTFGAANLTMLDHARTRENLNFRKTQVNFLTAR